MTEQALPENAYFRVDDFYIDVGDHRIFHGEESRHLEPKAMHVLYQLALSAGETVSRQELMDKVWHERVVIEDALTRVISQLRLNFNDSKSRQVIQTVPKKGYRLSEDVSWLTRQEFLKFSTKHSAKSCLKQTAIHNHDPRIASLFSRTNMASVIMLCLVFIVLFFALFPQSSKERDAAQENLSQEVTQNFSVGKTTIAFLPWRNLTGNSNNDYLAEMLPEELSVTLAKSDKVTVLAHSSAAALAKNPRALDSFIAQSDLAYWVEGSITQADERIRVLVRLVEKLSHKTMWSQVYEDDIQALLSLNARIISDVNTQLFGQGQPEHFTSVTKEVNIEAYRAYLQGNYWWMNGKTSEWFFRAETSFLKATELAPNFAAAFGSLAFIYARYNYHDIYMEKALAVTKATAAIDQALQLDPDDVNALLAAALLATSDLQFDTAEQLINRVFSVDPANTRGLYVYSELALAKNQFDLALTYADKALYIDPLSPWINVNKAIVYYWRNEMASALALVERAINIDSNYTWAYVWKAKILSQSGELTGAIEAMKACLYVDNGSPVNSIYLALLYAQANMPEQAQKWFSHTASLYGDSPDARFWQSYTNFIDQQEYSELIGQLVDKVTIQSTPFFSVVPLRVAMLSSQPKLIKDALPEFMARIERPNAVGFWVNYQNQYSAYAAVNLMQQLDSDEYEQDLNLLNAQIRAFERQVVYDLRADLGVNL